MNRYEQWAEKMAMQHATPRRIRRGNVLQAHIAFVQGDICEIIAKVPYKVVLQRAKDEGIYPTKGGQSCRILK